MIEDRLYPQIAPYRTHRLPVDPPHELHVEECGNPDGIPAVFLHGGPGAGAKPSQRRTFDPERYRIVLFDQRGCGRSTPSAELAGNDTAALIADIERVREHLGIDKWLVTGGSWGSLLSLAYAIAHPDRCLGLRVHGIFLGSPDETRFWFHGIGRFFPEAFDAFAEHVPQAERDDLLAAYYLRLIDSDPAVHMPAAQALRGFSGRTQTLVPSAAHVGALTTPQAALEISRIFTHYCTNRCFLPEDHVLNGVDALRHLPCEIVQGRYDVVTPPRAAWALAKAWPEARFTIVDLANHVAVPEAPALNAALRDATDRLADKLDHGAPTISDYLAPRACHSPALSDDGSLLAYLSDETGYDQIHVRDLAAGTAELRIALHEKVGAVAFRPGSRDLLFTTDTGGDERHQLHLLRDGASEAEPIDADPRVVHAWGAFDAEGRRIAYASNAAQPDAMAVNVRDLASGETRTVAEGPGWREALRFTPDGGALLVQDARAGMFAAELQLVDLASGDARTLLSSDLGAHVAAARWLEQGARLLLATDLGEGFHGLASLDVATGAADWIARPEGDVEQVAVTKDQARAAYTVNAGGYSRLILRDIASGAEREIPLPFSGRTTSLAFASGDAAVVVACTGFRRPSRIYRIDAESGASDCLAEGTSSLAETDTVEPQSMVVPSFDGAKVPVFVFTPEGAAPAAGRPALVIVHGGPESQYAAHWRSDVQYLVRRGWIVVAPNVRGSTGYGRAWQAADDRELRMDSVRDLKAVRDWLAARPDVDADRLAVYGQSYGGFMTLAAITEYPDDWRAAAEFYGIADFNTLMATTGPWRRTLRAVEYGDPDTEDGRALLHRLSPMRKIGAVMTPLFIAHGLDDPRVAPGESEMVFSALHGRGHSCEFLRVPHEGHGFARRANRERVFGALASFLERYVR